MNTSRLILPECVRVKTTFVWNCRMCWLKMYWLQSGTINLVQVKDGYEEFHFQFATYEQKLMVNIGGLTSIDDYNSQWKRLYGEISTSDYEDSALLHKTLQITQNGKEIGRA